ncbi:hypothetical protein FRACYDRAFT_247914 [Fragilariopsis cylindrus CCMP1102]|uniref:EGF-like domain-containing protein n=1 Tax=Fragilariopsis cylindrus CCMP1102 TaxID=635003 RepID=A0A1E7EUX7_9STRA|nr:hypothetical protein FRACYDRAFT_247914 [Fragilariopsis cylindrus CCMP1102]|eukprot:OEU09659.1 hypothetical protein FRACYDRAFT_247914 [Fragilariopsis cylindrus CCMP1102]
MKFSTSFTLAAMTLMSTCTDARIGNGQRELKQKCGLNPACPTGEVCNKTSVGYLCEEPDAPMCGLNPACPTGEVCNKTSVGYLCEEPDAPMCGLNPACPTGEVCNKTSVGYLCIDFDVSKKCDPNLGGQCFSEGTDYTCENSRVQGESPDYRCFKLQTVMAVFGRVSIYKIAVFSPTLTLTLTLTLDCLEEVLI